jgi:hypothetical protein
MPGLPGTGPERTLLGHPVKRKTEAQHAADKRRYLDFIRRSWLACFEELPERSGARGVAGADFMGGCVFTFEYNSEGRLLHKSQKLLALLIPV